jgi:hypothetical protein
MAGGFFLDKDKIIPFGYAIMVAMLLLFSTIAFADSEPNDNIEEAEIITLGLEVSGTLNYLSDEYDYYNITLEPDLDVVASLNGPENADFDLSILDKEGTELAGSIFDVDSNEKIIFRPTYAGAHFIVIWAYDGSGSYNLKVDYPETASQNSYSLLDAINNGYIEADVTGTYDGSDEEFDLKNGVNVFYGLCNIITIKSYVTNNLDIIIPAGQKFIAIDEDVEDKVVTKTETVNIQSLSQKEKRLLAMSINMYKNVPMLYTTYKVGPMASGNLLKIAEAIDENNHQGASGQVAIWMVSDDAQSSYLQQLGATSSMISSAKEMLIEAGINPPQDDDSEPDDGFDFGSIATWLCPSIIVILIIMAILGAIAKRREAKAASPPPTSPNAMRTSSQTPPFSSYQAQRPQYKAPKKTPLSPNTNKPPSYPPPPPPPPPISKTEKVEPVPYPAPKKDKKSKK